MTSLFGTPDWQKVSVWDGPLLLNEQRAAQVGAYVSPVLNVSRFARLAGHVGIGTQTVGLFVQWYEDAAATIVVGARLIELHPSVIEKVHLQLPNLGPFMVLTLNPDVPANPFLMQVQVFGSNRQQSVELVPQGPSLVNYGATNIGAGVQLLSFFNGYFSGPALLYLDGGAAFTVALNMYVNEHGTARTFYREDQAAAARINRAVVIPATACYLAVTNTSAGAANFQATIAPSYTGG